MEQRSFKKILKVRTDKLATGRGSWEFLMDSKTPLNPNLRVQLLKDSKLEQQLRITKDWSDGCFHSVIHRRHSEKMEMPQDWKILIRSTNTTGNNARGPLLNGYSYL